MTQRTSKYPPKTLVSLTEVRVFAATFVDGQQHSDTRLVAKIGDNVHFLHPEGVDSKIKQPALWLKQEIAKQLAMCNSECGSVEVPQDNVEDLPMGTD